MWAHRLVQLMGEGEKSGGGGGGGYMVREGR